MLVANVVLNRHKNAQFPNGIYNVIHQSGVNAQGESFHQFTPVANGSYAAATPLPLNIQAANEALIVDRSKFALYFRTIRGADGSWHERAADEGRLTRLFDHGAHRFYK